MNEIKQKIKEVISTVMEIPLESIDEGTSPDVVESWDSLRHLNLAVALEEAFGIELNEEDIMELMNFKLIEIKVIEILGNQK